MLKISVESPFAAPTRALLLRNKRYAQEAVQDALSRNEAPFASHLFYTQFLDDAEPRERRAGLDLSHEWRKVSDKLAVYTDLGISSGMREAIALAELLHIPIEYRTLPGWSNATR